MSGNPFQGEVGGLVRGWFPHKNGSMAQKPQQIEERLSRLESELPAIKAALQDRSPEPWYRQIVGDFEGDEFFAEMIRLGRKIRRRQREV